MEKRTNYVEAVGLIMIGFGLYECVFGTARSQSGLNDWGTRFWFILGVTIFVAFSLNYLQKKVASARKQEIASGDNIRRFPSLGRLAVSIILGLQLSLPYAVTLAFGPKQGTMFLFGFLLLDLSIFSDRQTRKEK